MTEDQILQMFSAINERLNNLDKKYGSLVSEEIIDTKENNICILDIADLTDENSTVIEELAEKLRDHEDRISALEEKN